MNTLYIAEPNGGFKPAPANEIIAAAQSVVRRKLMRGQPMESPQQARAMLPALLGDLDHEVFCLIHLDNRRRVIKFEELFRGTIDGASVHPREVVKSALLNNAAAVILVHNHPSGNPEPSEADKIITRRLIDALALIDIKVLDHFIVAGADVTSFTERCLIQH